MLLKDAQAILGDALAPLSYDQFFDDFIGQKPLVLPAATNSNRPLFLGDDPQKTILQAFEQYAPTLKCHAQNPAGPAPAARAVNSPEAFQGLVTEYHSRNYTVRIPEVDGLTPEIALFTRALEVIFRKPAGAILFWSQNQTRSPIHYDRVDVIALQLVGTKRWYLSEEAAQMPNSWPQVGDGPPALGRYQTFDVNPGDLVYFPRGTAHAVESMGESIHIAIEFVPLTIRDAINSVLDHFSDLHRPLRLNASGRADDLAAGRELDHLSHQIRDGLAKLAHQCQSETFIGNALAHSYARMLKDLPKLPQPDAPPQITQDTKVRHNALSASQIMTTPDILDFTQPGDQFLIHLGTETAMRFIASHPEFQISDIPGGLPDDVRIALASRLLMTGFLELAE